MNKVVALFLSLALPATGLCQSIGSGNSSDSTQPDPNQAGGKSPARLYSLKELLDSSPQVVLLARGGNRGGGGGNGGGNGGNRSGGGGYNGGYSAPQQRSAAPRYTPPVYRQEPTAPMYQRPVYRPVVPQTPRYVAPAATPAAAPRHEIPASNSNFNRAPRQFQPPQKRPPTIAAAGGGRALPRPQPMGDRRVGPSGAVELPRSGPDHHPLTQSPLTGRNHRIIAPGGANLSAIRDESFRNSVRNTDRGWDLSDRGYHWQQWNGNWACHRYDGRFHWWGFYMGSAYFWTIDWYDNYWWYDPYCHRWCYLYNDAWWWQDPANMQTAYLYQDGDYYQYDDAPGGEVVLNADQTPPVDAPPADDATQPPADPVAKVLYSPDGTRAVQITRDNADAYLYDTADPPAFNDVWLGSGVTDVRFRMDGQNQLIQILTIMGDDRFNVFDKNGNSSTAPAAPAQPMPVNAPPSPQAGPPDSNSPTLNALGGGNPGW
jgi:hypothetical protein